MVFRAFSEAQAVGLVVIALEFSDQEPVRSEEFLAS
jgi:hypothetical protein